MIPVRKDLQENLANVFDEGWVGQIYKTSIDQIALQLDDSIITIVPIDKDYPKISDNYLDAWYDIAIEDGKAGTVDKASITTKLETIYTPKSKEILGDRFPEKAEEK